MAPRAGAINIRGCGSVLMQRRLKPSRGEVNWSIQGQTGPRPDSKAESTASGGFVYHVGWLPLSPQLNLSALGVDGDKTRSVLRLAWERTGCSGREGQSLPSGT